MEWCVEGSGGPSGQQLMPWKGGRLKRSSEQCQGYDTKRYETKRYTEIKAEWGIIGFV